MKYLLFDTTFLAHRARFSTGSLKFDGNPTGVAFGVLRDIETQMELHGPAKCLFAFDYGGAGLRGQLSPTYKISRQKELNEEEAEEQKLFLDQCRLIHSDILPSMGFNNLYRVRGLEGDDILARLALDLPMSDEGVIITGDHDMWQCLRENVIWHSPAGRTVTFASFKAEWDIFPFEWATAKSIAGCSTDDVEGVPGVGEKTAVKWMKGLLKPESKKSIAIYDNLDLMKRNLPLVTLPFEGTPSFKIVEDDFSEDKKREVYMRLGIRVDRRAKKAYQGFDL